MAGVVATSDSSGIRRSEGTAAVAASLKVF